MPLYKIFSTPIKLISFSREYIVCEDISRLILDISNKEKYRKLDTPTNQHNIYESHFSFLETKEPCIQNLKKYIFQSLYYFIKEVTSTQYRNLENTKIYCDSWFHVTTKDGYITGHNHPNASWSCIYMVNPGDPDMGGILNIHDPMPHRNMYKDPTNSYMTDEFKPGSLNLPMQANQLLIFPSYLYHDVTPYHGDSPRVTIAANFTFGKSK